MVTLFPLGQITATPGALETLTHAGMSPAELLTRHQAGDWGAVPAEDAAENARSLSEGARLVSSYPVGAGRVWVITEWDRSLTIVGERQAPAIFHAAAGVSQRQLGDNSTRPIRWTAG